MRRPVPLALLLICIASFALASFALITFAQEGEGDGQGETTYVMQPGDTLESVARENDISLEFLIAVNNIENVNNVPAGTVLSIPTGAPAFGVYPAVDENGDVILDGVGGGGGNEIYIYQPGDTLDEIAQQYDISLISLLNVNELENGANIQPGTVILIPLDAPPYGVVPPLTPVESSETAVTDTTQGQGGSGEATPLTEVTYTVQEGDTYGSIAAQYSISVVALLQYNGITGPSFNPQPETVLLIPVNVDSSGFGTGGAATDTSTEAITESETTTTTTNTTLPANSYVMQPNDNLDGIAQQFDVSYEVLLAVNGLEPGVILPAGTVLVIPEGAPPYGVYPPVDENGDVILDGVGGGGGGDIYIMQPGDTLDVVAQQYDVSLISLLQANGLEDGANVPPGTVIVIPLDAPAYGVTPPLFTAQGEAIPAGTVVEDPATTDTTQGQGGGEVTAAVVAEPEVYVVAPNDNLTRIARRLDVSLDCLIDANNIANPDLIYAGQELIIPATCPAFAAAG